MGRDVWIKNNRQRFLDKQIRAATAGGLEPIDIRVFHKVRLMRMRRLSVKFAIIMDREFLVMGRWQLFRTNTQARMLLEKMMEHTIPFKMQDAMPNIYQHWVTQDMMAYIQIALGSTARSHYLRIINRPNRYVSRQMLDERQVAF